MSVREALGGSFVHVLRVREALGGSFVCVLRVQEAPGGVRLLTALHHPKSPGGSAKENKHSKIGSLEVRKLEVWMFGCLEKFGEVWMLGSLDVWLFGAGSLGRLAG